MVLTQRNFDYNKYFQVKFVAYIQASQVNDKSNTNLLRKFDGVHLCSAPNLQGGHHILDMRTGNFNKIPKVVEIPITYNVINVVGKWLRSKDLSH